MKHRYLLPLMLAFAVQSLCTANSKREVWESYHLVIVGINRSDPAFTAIKAGAEDARKQMEKKHRLAISLEFVAPDSPTPAGQKAVIESLDARKISGLAVMPVSLSETALILRSGPLSERPVVSLGVEMPAFEKPLVLTPSPSFVNLMEDARTVSTPNPIGWISSDDNALGTEAARQMVRSLWRNQGSVALFSRSPEQQPALQLRIKSATDFFQTSKGVKVLGFNAIPAHPTAGRTALFEVLRKDIDHTIDGILLLEDAALASGERLPWKREERVCVAISASPSLLHLVSPNQIQALVMPDYHEWGFAAVQLLVDALNWARLPESPETEAGYQVVTPANVSQVRSDWAKWLRR